MSLNIKKAEIQQAAFEAWNIDKFNTCILHTGMGKTFLFFKCLLSVDAKQVLMLAETNLRENTIKIDAQKYAKFYGVNPLKGRKVIFMCYQSAYKTDLRSIFPKNEVFVFADEYHDAISSARWEFFRNSDWTNTYFLGVTATLDRTTIYQYPFGEFTKFDLGTTFAPLAFEYTIQNAKEDGTTRDLQIYVYNHKLDSVNKTVQGTKTWIDTEYKVSQWLDGKFRTTMFMRESTQKKAMFRFLMNKRNSLLYNLPSKIAVCKQLLSQLPGRTIVFANTTESLSQLGIPMIVAENKNSVDDLAKFQSGEYNQIGSNKMLLQGENLNNLDNIVILSYYSKPGPLTQRIGRSRQDANNSIGKVVIFKTLNSQEEKWFENMILPLETFQINYIDNILNCL